MKMWRTVLTIALAGCVWANDLASQNRVLKEMFANIGPNDLPLEHSYFAVKDPNAPNGTLYRFNMTNGFLRNLHQKLAPTYHEEYCSVDVDRYFNTLRVHCDFDLEGMYATYNGALYYGAKIVQNFTIKAFIIKHSGVNPALLSIYTRDRMCKSDKCRLEEYSVFITAFELNTTASPRFSEFTSNPKFQNFKNNPTLSAEVWADFNVKMYTDVLPKIVRALKATYRAQIPTRMTAVGVLDKKLFRGPVKRVKRENKLSEAARKLREWFKRLLKG